MAKARDDSVSGTGRARGVAPKPRAVVAKTAGIGTLRESGLHADLKRWYAQPGDEFEIALDGYVIDIRRGEYLIEIQTPAKASPARRASARNRRCRAA